MTAAHVIADTAQPRALGSVDLRVKSHKGVTCLSDLRQAGSLKCLFPRREGKTLEAVLVNTAGGVTGGDCFACDAQTGLQTELTLTTQAAERAYRADGSHIARIQNRLAVSAQSRLNWLPQETILFDGCALRRHTQIELAPDATLLFCEPLVFGRMAMGERVRRARLHDRVEVKRAGHPLYIDALRFEGDVQAQLDRPFVANGARAMASLVYIASDAQAHLNSVRALLPTSAGASLLAPDILVLRLLAADSYDLRRALLPILYHLYRSEPPRCWMI